MSKKIVRVGIPRALLYYQYYPMWKIFFEELGAEVVVSPTTTKVMLSSGSSRVVADTCLPVKVFVGHVLSLVKECDYIFIPAIRSVESRVYNCSKFLGLPDMTRAVVPESPPILDIEIDINKGERRLYQAIYSLGRRFNWNPLKVRRAAMTAWQTHLNYIRLMSSYGLTPPQAIGKMPGTTDVELEILSRNLASPQATIAIIGHPYLLYDEHVNHRLIYRMQHNNIKVLTPEMVATREIEVQTARLVGKPYWTYEHEVVGAGGYYLENGVDGIIGIMAFGCGPDSLMMDMVRRQAARQRATAFMCLTLEEHTAETGVITRLEAFLDMIQRKKRRQAEICV